MTKFAEGNKAGPHGSAGKRASAKMVADQLRYLANQPVGAKGLLGKPKKMNALQSMCRSMINEAIKGNMVAFKEFADRVDGKVSEAGNLWDEPQKNAAENLTLKEVARRIGFILLSQAPDQPPTSTAH